MLKGAPHVRSPHPAKLELVLRGETIRQAASEIGYCRTYLSRVLNHGFPATAEVRRRLSAHLARPERELFDAEGD